MGTLLSDHLSIHDVAPVLVEKKPEAVTFTSKLSFGADASLVNTYMEIAKAKMSNLWLIDAML